MTLYNIKIVHEDSGISVKFQYESNVSHEDDLASQIFSDISVTVSKTTEE